MSVESTERGLRILDLDSKNGVHVGALAVTAAYLVGGETVTLGSTSVHVEAVGGDPIELPRALRFGRMIGTSPAMRRLYPFCAQLAASSVPVLIEGETGTGKEVLAEALHECSPRASRPFVVFDCAGVSPHLVESALFGHERGAFTGATGERAGIFELADGGTLLIDEIGELALDLQPRLLRALESGRIQRVGGNKWISVDVRVLAATRRDLDREVLANRFRDDLFFRLAVARIELPPLRNREGDIPILAMHLWRMLGAPGSSIPPEVLERFKDYRWPGNVRELRNAVARFAATGDATLAVTEIASDRSDSPPGHTAGTDIVASALEQGIPFIRARERVIRDFERRYVEQVLARHQGNVAQAASASGIARRYFQLLRARSKPRNE
jgi:transcriptional regulator with GAF, ATPase, and Fis domain